MWARAVQRATQSPYSHCAFAIGDWTYEADVGGVQSRVLSTYSWKYDMFGVEGMDDHTTAMLHVWCRETLRSGYDYGKVFGMALDHLFGVSFFRPLMYHRGLWQCAEYVVAGLRYVDRSLKVPQEDAKPYLLLREPRLYLLEKGVPE